MSGAPSPQERLRALGAAVDDRHRPDWRRPTRRGHAPDRRREVRDAGPRGMAAADAFGPASRLLLATIGRLRPRARSATLLRLLGDPDRRADRGMGPARRFRTAMRVDGATAPLLLDWWARQPRRSEAVFAALGRRGEWLASLNPDWHKPVATTEIPADADDVWQAGKSAERLAILTTVRRQDPARALALVESTWQSDGANDRQRFLEALVENRSMADEPFLEAALDDRSKLVRRQAAAVLALIPGSRLRQRLSDAREADHHGPDDSRDPPRPRPAADRSRAAGIVCRLVGARRDRGAAARGRRPEGLVDASDSGARRPRGVDRAHRDWRRKPILESLKRDDYFGDALQALDRRGQFSGRSGVEHGAGSIPARSDADRRRCDCRAPRRAPGRSARVAVARDGGEGATDNGRPVDGADIVRPSLVAGVLRSER